MSLGDEFAVATQAAPGGCRDSVRHRFEVMGLSQAAGVVGRDGVARLMEQSPHEFDCGCRGTLIFLSELR